MYFEDTRTAQVLGVDDSTITHIRMLDARSR